jgi:hypothetical protein
MFRVGRPYDRMPLSRSRSVTGSTSLLPPLYISHIFFKNIFLLARPSHSSQRRAAVSLPHSTFATTASSPARPHRTLLAPCSYPSHATTPATLAPCSRSPTHRAPTHTVGHTARLCWCWWCRRVPQVGPHRAKGTHEHGPC